MTTQNFKIPLDKINKKMWFNWQQPACPLFLGGCVEATGKPFREFFKFPFFTSLIYFRHSDHKNADITIGSWILRLDEGTNTGAMLVDLLQIESIRNDIKKLFQTQRKKLDQLSDEINLLSDDPSVDIETAKSTFADFFSSFRDFYTIGSITEPIQWRVEQIFNSVDLRSEKVGARANELLDWSDERIKDAAFSTNAEPYTISIEKSLLSCLVSAQNILSELHSTDSKDELLAYLASNSEFQELLTLHTHNFYWHKNNYNEAIRLTQKDFMEEISSWIWQENSENNLSEKLDSYNKNRSMLLSDRNILRKNIPFYIDNILTIGDEFGSSMADARKVTMLKSLGAIEAIAGVLSNLTSTPLKLVKQLMPSEITFFLDKPDLYRKRLEERLNGLLLIDSPFPLLPDEFAATRASTQIAMNIQSVPNRFDLSYIEGDRFEAVYHEINDRMSITKLNLNERGTLSGDVAYRPQDNILLGTVHVVTDPKHDIINPGDILVATSTTPDFMHLIRKAGAIVTDQYGMTTHAALASRELKIPCIVGTAVGSMQLSTGDRVEINFETGHIKRIEI